MDHLQGEPRLQQPRHWSGCRAGRRGKVPVEMGARGAGDGGKGEGPAWVGASRARGCKHSDPVFVAGVLWGVQRAWGAAA